MDEYEVSNIFYSACEKIEDMAHLLVCDDTLPVDPLYRYSLTNLCSDMAKKIGVIDDKEELFYIPQGICAAITDMPCGQKAQKYCDITKECMMEEPSVTKIDGQIIIDTGWREPKPDFRP